MKIYSYDTVMKFAEEYDYEVLTYKVGVLLDNLVLMPTREHYWYIICKEVPINCNLSGYSIRRYRKLPQKYMM